MNDKKRDFFFRLFRKNLDGYLDCERLTGEIQTELSLVEHLHVTIMSTCFNACL